MKTIESYPRVVPVGEVMQNYFESMELDDIIFVRTEGLDLLDLSVLGEYTYDISTDALVNYYNSCKDSRDIHQIVVLDTNRKTIIGLTSCVDGFLWFPIVNNDYTCLGIGTVLLVLAAYSYKGVLKVVTPGFGVGVSTCCNLYVFMSLLGFKPLICEKFDIESGKAFLRRNYNMYFIRRELCNAYSNTAEAKSSISNIESIISKFIL